ncbi:MAG: Gfo/Idh/MocA family oxidoreductase [Candidatus Omnitrophica bacterium]|nr:Gfo/Idh/MocA family oxidoreductase [Candidatus Omnitrophota bacterium]
MRVGIVGAGLQAKRRAPILKAFPNTEIVVISSEHLASAEALARPLGCEAAVGWDWVAQRDDLDAILVCTPPHLHHAITLAAVTSGKHVLCEKPLARTLEEATEMVAAAWAAKRVLKCGFNHRHHPGVIRAKHWVDQGNTGPLIFVRCRYGICGRPGYEQEWRADPAIVGGGQLMEQGIHAIDLARMFLGDFQKVTGFVGTSYWQTGPLEDNGFVLLQTAAGQMASIHASLTQWKNIFSLEVFGRDGYAVIEGLGGSYGNERVMLGRRAFDAPFAEEVVEFRGQDSSWKDEWREFASAIAEGREPLGSGADGVEGIRLVLAAYEAAQRGVTVSLEPGRGAWEEHPAKRA